MKWSYRESMIDKINEAHNELTAMIEKTIKMAKNPDNDKEVVIAELEYILEFLD